MGIEDYEEATQGFDRVRDKAGAAVMNGDEAAVEQPNEQPGKEEAVPAALHFTSCGDLLNEPEEVISWLVEPHLPASGLSMLAGKPKAGKSTLARCLALAIARGEPWLELIAAKGTVLYLALEEKRSEVKRHFQAMGATDKDDIRFFIAPSPQDGVAQLRRAAEHCQPALIIVDPLIKMVRVKDLNDYAQVSIALEPLLNLARETGAHVMTLHHLGKGERQGGDSILGSTALFAGVDTALLLKRSEKYRTLSSIQRYGVDMQEITLDLDPTTRFITAGAPRQEVDQAQVADTVEAFLKGLNEWVEEKVILEQVEGRRGVKVKALRDLIAAGRVSRTGEGGKKDPYKYGIQGSCSLVPTICWEQENKNQQSGLSARNHEVDSCSRENAEISSCSQPAVPPKDNENHDVEEVDCRAHCGTQTDKTPT